MPKKEQDRAIDLFRKEAIKVHNMKMLNTGQDNFLRERSSTKPEDMMACTGCNGFLNKSYKAVHQLICPGQGTDPMIPLVALESTTILNELSEDFKKVLATLHLDSVGNFVKTDEIILMIGNRYFSALKRKKGKKAEGIKYVRSRIEYTWCFVRKSKTIILQIIWTTTHPTCSEEN